MPNLIVHGDDLGLSPAVNEGILEAHTEGILTSASIMANGEAFEHAVALVRATPSLDVGIHLTLVEERPLLAPDRVGSLVDAGGRFHRHATAFALRYCTGRIGLDEVRSELDAQIRRVLSEGLRISHLDSHQHLHVLPGVLRVVAGLADRYDIPAIRLPAERLPGSILKRPPLIRAAQLLILRLLCRRATHLRLATTDHFVGFLHGGRLDERVLPEVLESIPPQGTCELMCHPGRADPAGRYRHWGYRWADELRALTAPDLGRRLTALDIRLCSWRDLVGWPRTSAGSELTRRSTALSPTMTQPQPPAVKSTQTQPATRDENASHATRVPR
ncbi:MAG: carbohydrate deacetylase [Planctomycetota bacterium]|jgi:hopanoid biosynthesis associated protein HpnK